MKPFSAHNRRWSSPQIRGQQDPTTGGEEILLHPTLTYSSGHDLLFFGIVSVPVWRDFKDPRAQDDYRLGTGLVYAWQA